MEKTKVKIRPIVMGVTVALFVLMLAAIVIDAETFYDVLNNLVMNNMMWGLGWVSSLVCLFMVIVCIVIMVTPLGKIRLGGPNAQPKFSYMQWFGISLCTGIGAGVVFWGAAEPLLFAMEPSPSTGLEPGSNGAILWSMVRCFMHWGFTPYANCVVMGVILAYVILNKGAPFKTSSLLVPIFGDKVVNSKLADAFDAISAFALTGAVAGGLGYGAMQRSTAVDLFAGLKPSLAVYAVIIAMMFVCYNASAVSGLRSGITWLSNRNTQLFFLLLIFVFLAGPTGYICNLFTESIGSYINEFFANSLNTAPYPDSAMWPQNWDMYWWVDWMAYAPLLGLFMVRVGYGRTLREFIMVEWVFPALFGIIWFSVFGGTILNAQINNGIDFYTVYLEQGAEALTLALFDVLPGSTFAKIVMLVIITISLVTQCDSMTVTLAGMSMEGADENTEAPVWLKLFWGSVFAVVAIVFIALGGIAGVKTIKSFCGIPLTFICFAVLVGFLRYMAKRPREANGDYVYEDEVANAPDNGDPVAPKSKFLGKFGW
ncbi:MAG: BCCT family transporter [Butyricicoccus sp.]|nr:BCCT family transporter [Butyricicoccus sp.]